MMIAYDHLVSSLCHLLADRASRRWRSSRRGGWTHDLFETIEHFAGGVTTTPYPFGAGRTISGTVVTDSGGL